MNVRPFSEQFTPRSYFAAVSQELHAQASVPEAVLARATAAAVWAYLRPPLPQFSVKKKNTESPSFQKK